MNWSILSTLFFSTVEIPFVEIVDLAAERTMSRFLIAWNMSNINFIFYIQVYVYTCTYKDLNGLVCGYAQ